MRDVIKTYGAPRKDRRGNTKIAQTKFWMKSVEAFSHLSIIYLDTEATTPQEVIVIDIVCLPHQKNKELDDTYVQDCVSKAEEPVF